MKPATAYACLALSVTMLFATQSEAALASHGSCADARTNKNTWFISGGVPDAWTDALVNGVLVWDNVPNQSHNFVRYFGPPADWNVFRGAIDGKFGALAFTPADHAVVKYDADERWHLNVNVYNGSDSADLWSVAAHESGHILSLAHSHSCYVFGPANQYVPTMYGDYGYGLHWFRTLEDYDRDHERALYP